jgi:hypothetical protein
LRRYAELPSGSATRTLPGFVPPEHSQRTRCPEHYAKPARLKDLIGGPQCTVEQRPWFLLCFSTNLSRQAIRSTHPRRICGCSVELPKRVAVVGLPRVELFPFHLIG